jgi:hypothetical protein
MKFTWGKGIILAYLLFIAGVFIMVSISMTKDVDLVTQNYYDKEIKYQQQIDRINNSSRLNEQPRFEVYDGSVSIIFPKLGNNTLIKGEISFYRPSDPKKDFTVPIESENELMQSVNTENLQKGFWKIQLNWNANGVDYYNEEKIIIY